MGWRILQITKPCKLSVKNRQLVCENHEDKLTLPIEDISVIVLENKQIIFSNALLSELADSDIVLFSCDFSHIPSGCFAPFHDHSRYAEVAWAQAETSEPLKKRIWQEIVKAKIYNQASCLKFFNRQHHQKLLEIAKLVQSGDAKNSEAFAANIYWKDLFADFNRHNEFDIRNSALNYGYAVIRGCMARSVVGAGLLPCFGVHHANKLNAFNLVDDLMEPFRPFVDFQVNKLNISNLEELDSQTKNKLVEILTQNCSVNNEEVTLLRACDILALSVAKTIKNKNIRYLQLPFLKKLPLFE